MELLGVFLARYSSGGEAAFGGLVIGMISTLFIVIFNAIKNKQDKGIKEAVESLFKQGYTYFFEDQNGIYLHDNEYNLFILIKSEEGMTLKFIRAALNEEEIKAVDTFEEQGYIFLIKDKSGTYLQDKENITYILTKVEEKWILKRKDAPLSDEQKLFIEKMKTL